MAKHEERAREIVNAWRDARGIDAQIWWEDWLIHRIATALREQAEKREELRAIAKSALCVLSAARIGQLWHENMLKDFDFAIDGLRAALSEKSK